MKVMGMMVSRMRQGFITTINRGSLLKLFFLLDTDQGSEGRSVSMEDLYNRVAIGNDQKFDQHILGSADHPTGKATKELHQQQLLKSNQSQRSIVLYKVTRNHPTPWFSSQLTILREEALNLTLNAKGNKNSYNCFVSKYISERPHCPSEPPSPPKLYFMPRYKRRPCLLDVETFCSHVDVIERVH